MKAQVYSVHNMGLFSITSEETIAVVCNINFKTDNSSITGSKRGIYEITQEMTTNTGTIELQVYNDDAANGVFRIEAFFGNTKVKDSLYIGAGIPDTVPSFLIGTHTNVEKYSLSSLEFFSTGATEDVTVSNSDVSTFAFATPGQQAYQIYTMYISKEDPFPTLLRLRITVLDQNTTWSIPYITCPT
jgi:hypothetical protein